MPASGGETRKFKNLGSENERWGIAYSPASAANVWAKTLQQSRMEDPAPMLVSELSPLGSAISLALTLLYIQNACIDAAADVALMQQIRRYLLLADLAYEPNGREIANAVDGFGDGCALLNCVTAVRKVWSCSECWCGMRPSPHHAERHS